MLVRFMALASICAIVLVGLFLLLRPGPPGEGARGHSEGVEISDGAMSPEEISVDEGDRVTLRIASEDPVGVHVHGYDLEEELGPGDGATLLFEADAPGRFPVEDHRTGAELGVLVVEPR